MSDTYQAVYDATRSKIGHVDSSAVMDAVRQSLDFSYLAPQVQQAVANVEYEMTRPSVLFKPALSLDGNQWLALLGANLQEGCAGFGDSPNEAMRAFDKAFTTPTPGATHER